MDGSDSFLSIDPDPLSSTQLLPEEGEEEVEEVEEERDVICEHLSGPSRSEGPQYLLDLFSVTGKALRELSKFSCNEAIATLQALPSEHYNTAWVLTQVARAYFEMGQYRQAQKVFQKLRHLDPSCTQGMEYYSVTLWQLQDEVALSGLAQELVAADRLSPQTWCAVGNCFSLQKEHQTALRFFNRAIQLAPNFAYTYTLCGHEYIANDDLDKAFHSFRKGIRCSPTHYNAWYGLGLVFFRQKKFDLSYYHFQRACQLNSASSTIRLYLGLVLREQGKLQEARAHMEAAISIDPKNLLAKFHHASILRELKDYERSLAELNELQQVLPTEAPIYMLLGKIHHRLKQYDIALGHFHTALDLSPRDSTTIKPMIERLTSKAAAAPPPPQTPAPRSTPLASSSFQTPSSSTPGADGSQSFVEDTFGSTIDDSSNDLVH